MLEEVALNLLGVVPEAARGDDRRPSLHHHLGAVGRQRGPPTGAALLQSSPLGVCEQAELVRAVQRHGLQDLPGRKGDLGADEGIRRPQGALHRVTSELGPHGKIDVDAIPKPIDMRRRIVRKPVDQGRSRKRACALRCVFDQGLHGRLQRGIDAGRRLARIPTQVSLLLDHDDAGAPVQERNRCDHACQSSADDHGICRRGSRAQGCGQGGSTRARRDLGPWA
mmetsp:Transcript_53911/g.136662  ORF Transcript_53911/g.136662 Transcript_53911/m.136662 type:complete len:224 (+) Transcript_53911:424-1095(+)